MSDRQRDRHNRRKAAERQIERQRELRDNALHYARAGEQVAAFTVALCDAVLDLVGTLPNHGSKSQRIPKHAHHMVHELVGMVLEAHTILEPFRGRICMDALDEIVDVIEGHDDDEDGGDDDEPTPGPTPSPSGVVIDVVAEAERVLAGKP